MTDACIQILNIGANWEKTDAPEGVVFTDGYGHANVHDYVEDDEDSIAEDDDKSYETSDDSTMEGDHDIDEEDIGLQEQEDQQGQGYFGDPNIQEVNEEDTEDEGVTCKIGSTFTAPAKDGFINEQVSDGSHIARFKGIYEDKSFYLSNPI